MCVCVHIDVFVPPCMSTPEFLHAAMRPDVVTETVVEVSTEEAEPMEVVTLIKEPRVMERDGRKKKGKNTNVHTYTHNQYSIQLVVSLIT